MEAIDIIKKSKQTHLDIKIIDLQAAKVNAENQCCVLRGEVNKLQAELAKEKEKYDYKKWPWQTHLRAKTKIEHLEQIKCLFGEELEKLSWIPVEERLPEHWKYFLAYNLSYNPPFSVKVITYDGEHKGEYTHWKPIILPPEKESVK